MTSAPMRDPLADHLLTPQNAAPLLSDYQPAQLAGVRSMDRALLVKNAVSTVTIFAQRRRLIPHRAPRLGPAHRPPGPDRADAGTTLRHRVLVDAGIFAGALLRPGPLDQQARPPRHMASANRTSHGRPRPSGMTPLAGTSTCTAVRGRSVLRCSGRANHHDPVTPPHLPGGKPGSGPPPGRNSSAADGHGRARLGAAGRIPTEGRCSVSTEQRENLEGHPAAVSLPVRQRRQRAAAAAPGVCLGAAAARRRDRDRGRTGRCPNRRDHRRRNRTSP